MVDVQCELDTKIVAKGVHTKSMYNKKHTHHEMLKSKLEMEDLVDLQSQI
jgi:hypothetical protein